MFSCCKAKDGSEPTKKSDAPAVEKKEEAPAEGEAPAEAAPEAEVAAEWNSKFSSRDAFHILLVLMSESAIKEFDFLNQ